LPTHYKASWVQAHGICQNNGMEFVSLDTLAEADNMFNLCQSVADKFDHQTHVGAITIEPQNVNTWYWVNSGNRVDYDMKFDKLYNNPDNSGGIEYCLSLIKRTDFSFNDLACYGHHETKFICQVSYIESTD